MQFEHDINDPLVEKVHFRHLAIGELMKRLVNEIDAFSDSESPLGGVDECVPSPDSAIILSKDDWQASPMAEISDLDGEIPERSPDSGLCPAVSGSELVNPLDDFRQLANGPESVSNPLVRLQRVNANYIDHEHHEEQVKHDELIKKEEVKMESEVQNQSPIDYSEDFAIGQIVWVWLSGHPLWPGMIAESPEHDPTPHLAYRNHNHKR